MPRTMYRIPDAMRADIIQQYTTPTNDGTWKGSKLIARDLGISDTAVRLVLRQESVPIRSAKEAHAHGKRCAPFKHPEQFGNPPLCQCGCGQPVEWIYNKCVWAKFVIGHRYQEAMYKDAAWLREQYETKRRNIPEIAAECGVNISTVARQMERNGIERRTTKESLIGVQAGANNPAWKGGTTPERQRLYKTQEWKGMLKSVYARDHYTCQRCKCGTTGGRSMKSSVAHHIKSYSDYPELRADMGNLVTLCRKCHLWVHSLANIDHEYLR